MTGKVGGGFSHGDLTVQPAPSNTGRAAWYRRIRAKVEAGDVAGAVDDSLVRLLAAENERDSLAVELAAARAEAEQLREALATLPHHPGCASHSMGGWPDNGASFCDCAKRAGSGRCSRCQGSGDDYMRDGPCSQCQGTGRAALAEAAPEETP